MNILKSRAAIALAIFVFVAILVVAKIWLPDSSTRYEHEFSAAIGCAQRVDFIECARPHVAAMLDIRDARQILGDLDARKVPPYQCHYLGHLVGQTIFHRYAHIEEAFSQCTKSCNAACQHGIIGEEFKMEEGLDDPSDVAHVDEGQLIATGKRLCSSISTSTDLTIAGACHGVGHAVFITYQDPVKSADICRSIASPALVGDCFRGLYMEFSDTLAYRSVWQNLYASSSRPTASQLSDTCSNVGRDELSACYYNLPLILAASQGIRRNTESREKLLKGMRPICESIANGLRRKACILGFGASLTELLLREEATAIRECSSFVRSSDQAICSAGLLSLSVEYRRNKESISFCSHHPSETRQACYRALFEKAGTYHGTVDSFAKLCPADQQECLGSANEAKNGVSHEFF